MVKATCKSMESPIVPILFKFLLVPRLLITHWPENNPETTLIKENKIILTQRNAKASPNSRNKEIDSMTLGKEYASLC